MSSDLDAYFLAQQVSPQWSLVLAALGEVLVESATERELHELFRETGIRMAARITDGLPEVGTLAELEGVLNEGWFARRWGWVEFEERSNSVEISHHAAPLAAVFGEPALSWSCGLLEGFYEGLFGTLGAGKALSVRAESSDAAGLLLRFRFSR